MTQFPKYGLIEMESVTHRLRAIPAAIDRRRPDRAWRSRRAGLLLPVGCATSPIAPQAYPGFLAGLEAHFQPIADAESRRLVGAEALVRMRRPGGTTDLPSEFLPALERAGLSRSLTRRMLGLAVQHVAGWRRAGHGVYVAVNATVADLLDTGFPDEVARGLEGHGVPPDALVLEVTENAMLSDPERIARVLEQLRHLGVEIALDDFGTGYSSLAHLRTLAVHEIKIDRSFVAAMGEQAVDAAIVHATIGLAAKLGLRAVAEGVEDETTWRVLAGLGCARVQGYLVGRPMEPERFTRLLGGQAGQNSPARA
jgi:diguanylate cyclase